MRSGLRAPAIGLLLLLAVAAAAVVRPSTAQESRLGRIQAEIQRLQVELDQLRLREEGVLGRLERVGTELRLRRAESNAVALELEQVGRAVDRLQQTLDRLARSQEERRRYLAFRLREVYRAGPDRAVRRLIGGDEVDGFWSGLRYAAFLSERDARVLRSFRADAKRLLDEQAALAATREELDSTRRSLSRAQRRLEDSRRQQGELLEAIRRDRATRRSALDELQQAAEEMTRLVDRLTPKAGGPTLDVHKFKGLLDWPAEGAVSAGFGTVVHPRFRTEVPHPGLDIDAAEGSDIKSVFDGSVAFSSWMRGYGLTAIVDHGGGLMSVYAHASVLIVEPGQKVSGGQLLGKVGDSGSLRGPFLYFELRVDGRPTDPQEWLRARPL